MTSDSTTQRITRLTPLPAILALIEARVGPAALRQFPLKDIVPGQVLAEDVVVGPVPRSSIALRDGFAVSAADVSDAGPYVPLPLPAAQRVDTGAQMPAGTDAVLPVDAVTLKGERAEAVAAVAAGEGVLPIGGDAASATALRRAGERLRAIDRAVLKAAGVSDIALWVPRVSLVCSGTATEAPLEAALGYLVRAIAGAGGEVFQSSDGNGLDTALNEKHADLVIAVGGTGSGRADNAVNTLTRLGTVAAHGIAVSPGETAALGFAGGRPVLLIPGRLDAALAVWLLIGRYLLARLTGATIADAPAMVPLKRKVTSTIGLTELIPVRCGEAVAEPLASGYLSLESLARSDGWIAVPADSEGFAAGTPVAVNPWP